jgi:hypothetical protein
MQGQLIPVLIKHLGAGFDVDSSASPNFVSGAVAKNFYAGTMIVHGN